MSGMPILVFKKGTRLIETNTMHSTAERYFIMSLTLIAYRKSIGLKTQHSFYN